MSQDAQFDRWYAARHARFLIEPKLQLETFGNTLVNYHLLSVLDDYPNKVRVREGRLEAHPPLVITPNFSELTTEGLSDEARDYAQYLKEHAKDMRVLQYGCHLKSDNFSEQILTEKLSVVTERVKAEVIQSGDLAAAVVVGVDEPWDVALVELWRREVERSARRNIMDLHKSGKLFGQSDGE